VKSRVIDPLMKEADAAPTAPVEPAPSAVDEDATE
jgi:hypothetical protein